MKKWRPDLLMMAMLAVTGCDRKADLDIPKTAAVEVERSTGIERNAFLARADYERAELDAKIEALKKQAAEAEESDKPRLAAQLQALEQEQRIADQTRNELDSAIGDRWESLKLALSESHDRLKQTLHKSSGGS